MEFKLNVSGEVRDNMEERGVKDEDVIAVLEAVENGSVYLRAEDGRVLGKTKIGNLTVYVEYKKNDGEYDILDAYCHKIALVSDLEA